MNSYEEALQILKEIPIIFTKRYMEDSGFEVKKRDNRPSDNFNYEAYKVV